MDNLIAALHKEISLQKQYTGEKIETIYIGGGTPSLLPTSEISRLLDSVDANFVISNEPEITLEANPDDINTQKIRELRTTNINRISLGVQSFFYEDLTYLNRLHTAGQSEYAIKALQDAGLTNISIDLIFGMPSLGQEHWRKNLFQATEMQIPHISAYAITVEPNTILDVLIRKDKKQPISEAEGAAQFRFIMNYLREKEYIHYEISNFSLPGFESKHNRAYWENIPYLGIGPSAHSFNKTSRQWNCSDMDKYLASIEENIIPCEKETLTQDQHYNEYIMMSLRTNRGISVQNIKKLFGGDYLKSFFRIFKLYENSSYIKSSDDNIQLSDEGVLMADRIISDFFIVD